MFGKIIWWNGGCPGGQHQYNLHLSAVSWGPSPQPNIKSRNKIVESQIFFMRGEDLPFFLAHCDYYLHYYRMQDFVLFEIRFKGPEMYDTMNEIILS